MLRAGLTVAYPLIRAAAARAGDDSDVPDDISLVRDVRYREGPNRQWVLDLAMPRQRSTEPRPAVVVIHGGGWIEGDKSSFSSAKQRVPGNIIDLATQGFVAVTINYHRLAASGHCPHSLGRVPWLEPVVNEFLVRTLRHTNASKR